MSSIQHIRRESEYKLTKILLTNIQRFSLHDGPGIRTTVFLKGCSLRCPWCSNPENLSASPQPYIKDGVEGIYGRYYDVEELVKECLKDKEFYEGKIGRDGWNIDKAEDIDKLPGGVTFSGGEALLQIDSLIPVCQQLHAANVHIAIETALFVPERNVRLALDNIDFFYVDMKMLDSDRCREVENGDLNVYMANLDMLLSWRNEVDGTKCGKPIVIRVPVIGKYTDAPGNRRAVKELVGKYRDRVLKIELIKEHNLGEPKYRSLNMQMDYQGVDDELVETYKAELDELKIAVEICRI